jgi:hypothetical protein
MNALRSTVMRAGNIADDELHIACSHTHAAGLMDRTRADLPGGELIGPYLDHMAQVIGDAVREAIAALRPASIVYGTGRCDLAAHRDFWDELSGQFVCGFNPAGPADDTVALARIDDEAGKTLSVVVNYACHPTTLAWQNTLVSPDYIGAMREVVEKASGGLCLFLQGASGDLGPREGYVGDPAVADRNGRQLGYAVLCALAGLPSWGTRFEYAGPVVSGATLGTWQYAPLDDAAKRRLNQWQSRRWTVDIPYRAGLPTLEQTQARLAEWTQAEQSARQAGDSDRAGDCRAHVERMTRQATRLGGLPKGDHFPLPVTVWRLGDGYWVMLEGEYYQALQRAIRDRFPETPIVVATGVNGWRPAYLPTRETYGLGIYQEQVAVLAPGCLETMVEAVATQIAGWADERSGGCGRTK